MIYTIKGNVIDNTYKLKHTHTFFIQMAIECTFVLKHNNSSFPEAHLEAMFS